MCTTGLAATVWVVGVWVEAGLEEEPQPAATAAVSTTVRESLRGVIVVKDATPGCLLPDNARTEADEYPRARCT